MPWEPPASHQPDVPEKPVFEYTIKLDYRVLVEERNSHTAVLLAESELEAIEKAWEKVYDIEGAEDIEEDDAEVVSVRDASVPGSRDDKTLNLFPQLSNVSRGTRGETDAQS